MFPNNAENPRPLPPEVTGGQEQSSQSPGQEEEAKLRKMAEELGKTGEAVAESRQLIPQILAVVNSIQNLIRSQKKH